MNTTPIQMEKVVKTEYKKKYFGTIILVQISVVDKYFYLQWVSVFRAFDLFAAF